jgi:hypothetical protein
MIGAVRRELRSVATESIVGAVDDGAPEPFEGQAAKVLGWMRRTLGDTETIRQVLADGWSNGYLYFADPTP